MILLVVWTILSGLAITLQIVRAAFGVLKSVGIGKHSKFMRGVLRPIVATDNFWNTMPCKDCFHGCNHSCRGGCGQPGHLRISRKTVRRKWAPSFSKRSVPTTCHGYSGSSVVNSGAFLGRAFLAQVGHAVLYHLFQLTCDPRPLH